MENVVRVGKTIYKIEKKVEHCCEAMARNIEEFGGKDFTYLITNGVIEHYFKVNSGSGVDHEKCPFCGTPGKYFY